MADKVMAFINSPVGPKTVQFWGPAANWGIVLAGILDANKPIDMVSERMTGVLFFYSCLFMRFAWRVQPRNLLLFSCHLCNATAQGFLLVKKLRYNAEQAAKQKQ